MSSLRRRLTSTVSNWLEEEQESLLSLISSSSCSISNHQELLIPASQLPEVVLSWQPSRVLFSEWRTTLSMKRLTMASNFTGTLLKVKNISGLTLLVIPRNKESSFMKLELKFQQAKQSSLLVNRPLKF
jgi:hypothetical protein